jgi:2-dehydropantoate 2-reductase
MPLTNGLPWWYFFERPGAFSNRSLTSLDPKSILARHVPIARIVGGVNYLAGTLVAPGHVHYVNELERRLVAGELNGSISPRLEKLCHALDDAGFAAKRSDDIRQVIWHKLWGNLAFNPLSALTGGTQEQLAGGYTDRDGVPDLSLIIAIMEEGRRIAEALNISLNQATESRIAAAGKMKGHRTSMYADITHGRQTEIEAIVGVVREIAGWLSIPTPHLDCLYTLVRMKEQFYESADGSGHA